MHFGVCSSKSGAQITHAIWEVLIQGQWNKQVIRKWVRNKKRGIMQQAAMEEEVVLTLKGLQEWNKRAVAATQEGSLWSALQGRDLLWSCNWIPLLPTKEPPENSPPSLPCPLTSCGVSHWILMGSQRARRAMGAAQGLSPGPRTMGARGRWTGSLKGEKRTLHAIPLFIFMLQEFQEPHEMWSFKI